MIEARWRDTRRIRLPAVSRGADSPWRRPAPIESFLGGLPQTLGSALLTAALILWLEGTLNFPVTAPNPAVFEGLLGWALRSLFDPPGLRPLCTLLAIPAVVAVHMALLAWRRVLRQRWALRRELALWNATATNLLFYASIQKVLVLQCFVLVPIAPIPELLRPYFWGSEGVPLLGTSYLLVAALATAVALLHAHNLVPRFGGRRLPLLLALAGGIAIAWAVPTLRTPPAFTQAGNLPELARGLFDDDARAATREWLRAYHVTDTGVLTDCLSSYGYEACAHSYERLPDHVELPRLLARGYQGLTLRLSDEEPLSETPEAALELPCATPELRMTRAPKHELAARWPLDEPELWELPGDWVVLKAHFTLDEGVMLDVIEALAELGVRRVDLAADTGDSDDLLPPDLRLHLGEARPELPELSVTTGYFDTGNRSISCWGPVKTWGPWGEWWELLRETQHQTLARDTRIVPGRYLILDELMTDPVAERRTVLDFVSILGIAHARGAREIWLDPVPDPDPR